MPAPPVKEKKTSTLTPFTGTAPVPAGTPTPAAPTIDVIGPAVPAAPVVPNITQPRSPF
jgi:hypothetical protein